MPRYYFDIRDGVIDRDITGLELRDDSAARKEAVRFLGQTLADEPMKLWNGHRMIVEVSDGQEVILFTLACEAHPSPDLAAGPSG